MDQNNKLSIRWFLIRLGLVIFDIFAVNVSYFAALLLRFYVASEFNVWAVKYIAAFEAFAPFYTLGCLVIFGLFKLYNSRWKYAGLNDLNRIVMACLVTSVFQVAGSAMFVMRMPFTYYVLGAAIQCGLLVFSRFSYRLFLVERKRILRRRDKTAIRVMVVGMGEISRIMLKHLQRDTESAAQPVCLVDYRDDEFGEMQEGLPVVSGIGKIPEALEKYAVESVILADAVMPQNVRMQIRKLCQEAGVDVQDFSGYFQDFRGTVSLRNLLEYTKGPVELVINGKRQGFANGEQALLAVAGKYVVSAISAKDSKLVIDLQTDLLVPNDVKEDWVQDYRQETGEDISFF